MSLLFDAVFLDGASSEAHPVRVHQEHDRLLCLSDTRGVVADVPLTCCTIEPALGRTRRILRLPGNGQLETADHGAVKRLEALGKHNRALSKVHWLEGKWTAALGALALIVAGTWLFVQFGLPVMAESLAHRVPAGILAATVTQSLQALDHQLFEPSQTPDDRQATLQQQFAELSRQRLPGQPTTLLFRHAPVMGANALAFPDGRVVVTDQLVDLLEEDQILAVLAHELGHLHARHGLRSLIQKAGLAFVISGLTGDMGSVSSLAAGLPTLLIETGYSRDFEREADDFSATYLLASGQGTEPLCQALARLADTQDNQEVPAYLSTHPDTMERIARLRALAP